MVKPKKLSATRLPSRWQKRFLSMLPTIEKYAAHRLRNFRHDEREDLATECVALAFCMFVTLARQGKIDLAFATPLAAYGCRQALAGRRVGSSLNVRDVTSRHCQKQKHVRVERLDRFDEQRGEWRETVVEDHRTPVPDQAVFRIDYPQLLTAFQSGGAGECCGG